MSVRGLFEWSETDHSLREVVEVFQNQLPVLAIVNEGYSGRDGMHEFASDEVYWIFDIQKQDKVVAKAALERYVSIPVDYPVPFQRIVDGKPSGSALSMCSIINDDEFRSEKIRFKDDVHVPFKFGAKDGSFDQFGEMEIIEKYSEKYLLCHSIVKTEIHPLVIGIPAYVPIRMEVALGFSYGRKENFNRWINQVSEISRNLENGQITPRQEILLFHESPGGDYEYVSPLKFTAHSYDDEDDSEEERDISTWQLPQSTTTSTPKKCYTVARNPIKVCIHPVSLPSIPGPGLGVPREAFTRATRASIPGPPKLPTRFTKTMDRRGEQLVLPKSSATLPPKSSSSSYLTPMSMPPLPPKSSNTLLSKLSTNHPTGTKHRRLPKSGNSLDEGEMGATSFGTGFQPSKATITPVIHDIRIPVLPKSPSRFATSQSVQRMVSEEQESSTSSTAQKSKHESNVKTINSRTVGTPTSQNAASKMTSTTGDRNGRSQLQPKTSDWKTLDDVPANLNISQLSVDDVARCLELLNLHDFVPFFQKMTVDGQMLLELDRVMLVEEFGLTKFDALRLTMFANKWRPKQE